MLCYRLYTLSIDAHRGTDSEVGVAFVPSAKTQRKFCGSGILYFGSACCARKAFSETVCAFCFQICFGTFLKCALFCYCSVGETDERRATHCARALRVRHRLSLSHVYIFFAAYPVIGDHASQEDSSRAHLFSLGQLCIAAVGDRFSIDITELYFL